MLYKGCGQEGGGIPKIMKIKFVISVYLVKIKLWKYKAYLRANMLNLRELPKWCTTWLKHLEKRSISYSWLLLLWNASALSATSQPFARKHL